MPRYIDADEILKDKVSNAYISRFEIELAPTADVQKVKHGKWLYNRNNEYETGIHIAECSRCDINQKVEFWRRKPIFEYCPHCGARMDGDDNGTI